MTATRHYVYHEHCSKETAIENGERNAEKIVAMVRAAMSEVTIDTSLVDAETMKWLIPLICNAGSCCYPPRV